MKKIQFIFTFDKRKQMITDYNQLYTGFLDTTDALLSFAMAVLDTDEDRGELIKISCAIQSETSPPEWFINCGGKFWLDDIERWRKANKIKSKVHKETIDDFYRWNPSIKPVQ